MRIVRDPEPDVACDFLRDELQGLDNKEGRVVQMVGDCEVHYQGRARSQLHRGERLIILKPDGTLLIHTAAKAKPVNWQPPGAQFHTGLEDGLATLTAYRAKPEELVKVIFHGVAFAQSFPLRDAAELALVGSEDDLQRLLFANPDLVEDGFVPRRRERDSKRGFYDIDGDDAQGTRLIVELKRTTAGVKEAQQLWRYVEPLRNGKRVRGILVAPRVADKARALLADHDLEWKELDWDDILPRVERMRRTGQVGLSKFG